MTIRELTHEEMQMRFDKLLPITHILAQEEAAVFLSVIGATIDAWCFYHDEDPAEVLRTITELSEEVNASGSYGDL